MKRHKGRNNNEDSIPEDQCMFASKGERIRASFPHTLPAQLTPHFTSPPQRKEELWQAPLLALSIPVHILPCPSRTAWKQGNLLHLIQQVWGEAWESVSLTAPRWYYHQIVLVSIIIKLKILFVQQVQPPKSN